MVGPWFRGILVTFSVGIALLSAVAAHAFPEALPFHGRLTYVSGAPYELPIDVVVTIETSADPLVAGTSPLWGPGTYDDVPVTDGIFTIEVGGPGSPSIDTAALASASQVWMAVWVDGTLMTPLYRVGAVPYAQVAHDAAALGGVAAASYAQQTDIAALQAQIDALQTALAQVETDVGSCCSGPANPCAGQADGTSCDDGTACTTGDTCQGGVCQSGSALDCDDSNDCTDDSCDSVAGCQNVDNTATCSDGDPCTIGDTCAAGACVASPLCDDGDSCTMDVCDASTLNCTFVGDLSSPLCADWSTTAPYACNLPQSPSLSPGGDLWTLGATNTCNTGDSPNNDRAVGIDTVTGEIVNSFTVASPASQPIFRGDRLTMSTDWNHNATCSGCQIQYNTLTGAIAWQGGLGPHPRGGISMKSDGTMFLAYGNIRAFNFDGSTQFNASGNSGLGAGTWIAPGGDIIGCGNSGTCRRINSSGTSQWQVSTGCQTARMGFDAGGSAAIVCPNLVRMLSPSGNESWNQPVTGNNYGPLLAADGDVLVGTADGRLVRFDNSDGTVISDYQVCDPAEFFDPWMITSDGWILGNCDWDDVVGVTMDGTDTLQLATTNETRWVALSSDGHLIVPDGNIIRRTSSGGWSLASTPWPTLDRNLQRSRDADTP